MALADKKHHRIYSTTGSDSDKVDSAKLSRMQAKFTENEYLDDEDSFETLAPVLYQMEQMSQDLDEIRRFITADIPTPTTCIGSLSTRISAYWTGKYYFGHASYGWNYYAWNYGVTSKSYLDDRYSHMGMVCPLTTNTIKVKASVKNDSSTDNVDMHLLKGTRRNGSSSSIPLTELGTVSISITTTDLHYNADLTITSAGVNEGDLLFLVFKREGPDRSTKYIQLTASIYA